MNLAQRIILVISFVLLFAAILFPPWTYSYKFPEMAAEERPAGYHLIFGQHTPQDRKALGQLFSIDYKYTELEFFSMRIDQTRLTFQIVGLLLLTVILYFLLRTARQ